jgi:hypothetical protein
MDVLKTKTKTQLEKDYMNLTNKELTNEQKLNDFIISTRCDAN